MKTIFDKYVRDIRPGDAFLWCRVLGLVISVQRHTLKDIQKVTLLCLDTQPKIVVHYWHSDICLKKFFMEYYSYVTDEMLSL